MYEVSPNSGNPAYSVIGGPAENNAPELNATQLISGALEMANVDIAAEFSDLIAYQRGLQASARTVSISDEILQSIINI
jgi:flagellar hook protein FlgE